MEIANSTVLVTGANRGIGRALTEEALRRGAKRVYAGTRQSLAHSDRRVTPLTLDVTDPAQIQAAVEKVASLDILVNNAGLGLYDDLSDRAVLEQHLAVNLFGTYGMTQAFLPLLTRSRGAIVNVVSIAAFASLPVMSAYSISKAAAFSLSQSLRALLAGAGRERSCRPERTRGHRYDPRARHPEGLSGVCCTRHLRRHGKRGGGHLPRSNVGVHGRELAQRRGQGARAPECGAPPSGVRRRMSNEGHKFAKPRTGENHE